MKRLAVIVLLLLSTAAHAQDPRKFFQQGVEAFRAGEIERSVEAFDALIKASPGDKPALWQRGITLYYAKALDRCIDQFVSHHVSNPYDAENSIWHYLCVAARDGHETARQQLIPARDPRVPMMALHRLFAGEAEVAEIFALVGDDRVRAFYANLYVGLWYESHGKAAKAREHLAASLDGETIGHYMEDVARVHLARIEAGKHWR